MKKNKERDNLIRTLYWKGNGGALGRIQHPPISRQRVFQIVSQKPQVSRWRLLWQRIMNW